MEALSFSSYIHEGALDLIGQTGFPFHQHMYVQRMALKLLAAGGLIAGFSDDDSGIFRSASEVC
jgi:hypothetical protein